MEDFIIPPPPGIGPSDKVKGLVQAATPQAVVEQIAMERAYRRVEGVAVHECRCQRCPKVWYTLLLHKPKTCPGCHNPWWDTPRKPRKGDVPPDPNGSEAPTKKKKIRVAKVKRPVGRPRKNAVTPVEPAGTVEGLGTGEETIPEAAVDVLGTVGGPSPAPDEVGGGQSEAVEEAFPVATPFNSRPSFSTVRELPDDQVMEAGQPSHGGGSQSDPDQTESGNRENRFADPDPLPGLNDDWDWG